MDELNIQWGRTDIGGLLDKWPKDENGRPEEPVFLCNCGNNDMGDTLRINMLEAMGYRALPAIPATAVSESLYSG